MNPNLREQLSLLPEYFQGHLTLTFISLFLGILLSIPLGIWAAQSPSIKRPLLAIISIIQTFPSVAILALVVALLGGQIGVLPAVVALVLYSILPIARNTVTGMDSVPSEVVEAAMGIGMNPQQVLVKVKLPLAMPVIIAGIRTAAVWTVGLATLSTLVGATSFGNYIFTGLQTRNLVSVTVGSIAAATMAVILDALIAGMQWLVENRNKKSIDSSKYSHVRNILLGTVLFFVVGSFFSILPKSEPDFVVGGKGFTEQYIIAGLLAAKLEESGFDVEQRLGLGTEIVYSATANNAVDVYLEYTGTVWANRMKNTHNPGRELVMRGVVDHVQQVDGMVSIGALGFQNLYALAMRKDRAQELGIDSIEDMIPVAHNLVAAGDLEFFGRPEWITLRETYGIDFSEKLTFDAALMYNAVDDRQVDLITAYTSDGRLAAFDLKILEDPRNAFLPYDGILVASSSASKNPAFMKVINSLVGKISDEEMRQANRIVDVNGGSILDAVNYLQSVLD